MHGVPPEDIGGGFRKDDSGKVISAGKYVPFGYTDFQQIVADIKQFAASGDACVINTINGDSNVPFFKEIVAAGLTPADCPVVSFSLAEDELRSMPTKDMVGELGCWTYFMSLKTPENKAFLKNWNDWLTTENYPGVVKEKRAVDSPMVLSYDGVYLWKEAVEKAGTFDVDVGNVKRWIGNAVGRTRDEHYFISEGERGMIIKKRRPVWRIAVLFLNRKIRFPCC